MFGIAEIRGIPEIQNKALNRIAGRKNGAESVQET